MTRNIGSNRLQPEEIEQHITFQTLCSMGHLFSLFMYHMLRCVSSSSTHTHTVSDGMILFIIFAVFHLSSHSFYFHLFPLPLLLLLKRMCHTNPVSPTTNNNDELWTTTNMKFHENYIFWTGNMWSRCCRFMKIWCVCFTKCIHSICYVIYLLKRWTVKI